MDHHPFTADEFPELAPGFWHDELPVAVGSDGLRGGLDTALTCTGFGFVLGGTGRGGSFSGYFGVRMGSNYATVTKGVIASQPAGPAGAIEPTINGVPISGDSTPAVNAPRLTLDPSDIDEDSQTSYIALCVQADANNLLTATTPAQILHRSDLTAPAKLAAAAGVTSTGTGPVGVHPIALITWSNGRPRQAFQIAYFNLAYVRTQRAAGQGAPQHFFFPQ